MKIKKIDIFVCSFIYFGFTRLTKKWWFENDFKEVFPDIFEPFKNRYDDRFCIDAESFEDSMKRIFSAEETTDFITKRKNRNIFQAPKNERNNLHINNNLNGNKFSDAENK